MAIKISSLENQLTKLPGKIYEQEKRVILAQEAYDKKELELDVASAVSVSKSKKTNATEKKEQAIVETQKIREDLIAAEMNLLKEKAYLNALKNDFDSLRKVASIEIELIRSKITGN